MSRPRCVLDASVIVSAALLAGSTPRLAFEWVLQHGSALLSDALQAELSQVLLRSKFDRYLSLEKRLFFLSSFVSLAIPITVTARVDVCRDPKDNMLLELAVSGEAGCIITGDADLLVLNPFRRVSILKPSDFLATYNSPVNVER